jgi:hypothetical protein
MTDLDGGQPTIGGPNVGYRHSDHAGTTFSSIANG